MPDYSKMYAILCAAASDAVDALEQGKEGADTARSILLRALEQAEELYISEAP